MMTPNAIIFQVTSMMLQERLSRVNVAKKHSGKVFGTIPRVYGKREATRR